MESFGLILISEVIIYAINKKIQSKKEYERIETKISRKNRVRKKNAIIKKS